MENITPEQAFLSLSAGLVDLKVADGGYVLDGVAFTPEQVVLMHSLGVRMSVQERLRRFLPVESFTVDERSRTVYWYDYHGVSFDADERAVLYYVRRVVEEQIGYSVSDIREMHDAGNGHLSARWEPLSDELLASMNEILARSHLPKISNRRAG